MNLFILSLRYQKIIIIKLNKDMDYISPNFINI